MCSTSKAIFLLKLDLFAISLAVILLFSGKFASAQVNSFNSRTGAVTLQSSDVTGALGYTPVNKMGDTMTGALSVPGVFLSSTPGLLISNSSNSYLDNMPSYTNVANFWTAAQSSNPEVGFESYYTSNVGAANNEGAVKINYFGAGVCSSGSSSCYGYNQVLQLNSGFADYAAGTEVDLNFYESSNATAPNTSNQVYGLLLSGVSSVGGSSATGYQATAGIGGYGAPGPLGGENDLYQNGIYLGTLFASNNALWDATSSNIGILMTGAHNIGWDTSNATLTYLINGKFFRISGSSGSASVGTTTLPSTGIALFNTDGAGSDINLRGHFTLSSGSSIESLNDAQTTVLPLEIIATQLQLTASVSVSARAKSGLVESWGFPKGADHDSRCWL